MQTPFITPEPILFLIEAQERGDVISEVDGLTTSKPSSPAEPPFYVLVPKLKPREKSTICHTQLLSKYGLVYHTHGFIICTICQSGVPWNYLHSHLKEEWMMQPVYNPGVEVAHDLQLRPKHGRVVTKDLSVSIQKEIGAIVKDAKFLTSEVWKKTLESHSVVEGVAKFLGSYCSKCKKIAQGDVGSGICKCGNILQLAIIQSVAYHWREHKKWLLISTLSGTSAKHPPGLNLEASAVEQLQGSKIRVLSEFITSQSPTSLDPVLSRLGLIAFCHQMWAHSSFSDVQEGLVKQSAKKRKLEDVVFKIAIKDYFSLATAHPTLKQLVFSNRRFVNFYIHVVN